MAFIFRRWHTDSIALPDIARIAETAAGRLSGQKQRGNDSNAASISGE
jgi:hypothetical protein